jgi:ADP-ribose pyrophosphatase YjhB (NUDIX family)
LPAGYLENGESVSEGAKRETLEEAMARVEIIQPFALYNLRTFNQVYFMFRAQLLDRDFAAGHESLEVGLFSESEIPWNQIAFTVIHETLRKYFEDRSRGAFPFHMGDVSPQRM